MKKEGIETPTINKTNKLIEYKNNNGIHNLLNILIIRFPHK
jgi:hypothetical protein